MSILILRSLYLVILVVLCSCSNKNNKVSEKKAEDTTSSNLVNLIEKADSLYQADVYSEAVKLYTVLISRDSLNGEFYYRRAHSYAHLPKPKFVPEDYLQAAKLGYREYESYYSLGVIYSTVNLNDSLAILYFKKALEEKPESEEVKQMLQNLTVDDAKSI